MELRQYLAQASLFSELEPEQQAELRKRGSSEGQTPIAAALAAAGERATETARSALLAAGINPVVSRDGVLLEVRPDGATQPYVAPFTED